MLKSDPTIKSSTLVKRIRNTLVKTILFAAIVFSVPLSASGQNPVAGFSADVLSGCAPLTVQFTDQSTGNPTEWNWEFSNGTLSTQRNPLVTFNNPGTYSVRLVVRNANGIDDAEILNYITVYPAPSVDFTANTTFACVPATVQFSDLSTSSTGGITQWEWDFGDGGTSTQQNPAHTYTATGFYSVTLAVTSNTGCRAIISKGRFIRIVDGVATDFSFSLSNTCLAPFTASFQNQSTGPGNISYNWDFGNSTTSTAINPSTIYNTPGSYTVRLNAVSDLGCSGSIQKTVTITNTNTDFTGPANVCIGQPVPFQNNSSAPVTSSFWDFGDGTSSSQINPIKTFLGPGTFTVKLINQYASCIDSITHTVTVNDKPSIDFMADDSSSCRIPFQVRFTDLSAGAVAWQWNFGDGGTSTQQNPAHTYTSFGMYTVTLIASVGSGCSDTITKTAFINIMEPDITINVPDGGCIPFTYTPRAAILTADSIATYLWDLGEPGAIFNVKDPPPYTYANAGNYTISLTVTTVSGCTKTVSIPAGIRTGILPVVNFSFSPTGPACASPGFTFTDLSTTTPGAQVQWIWDFGDGSGSSAQNPVHVFTDTGSLTVTLMVSNNGCIGMATRTVQVLAPVAGFLYQVDCNTKQVTFTDTSIVDPSVTPLTYAWNFGDGTTSNLRNPLPHTYPGPGTYNVLLTVTNGTCFYTATRSIVIADERADFSIDRNPVCKNEIFTLSATTSPNIRSYNWVVGGIPLSGNLIKYSFSSSGTYSVSLTVTDINGCTNTKSVANYITVRGPSANFNPAAPGACLNKAITFNDLSTPAASIRTWEWDFGDGIRQTFTAPPFTHTYRQEGSYTVSLKITDASGCTDQYTMPARLLVTNPKAGFSAPTFYCPGAPLQFSDTSSGAGLSYIWSFGDGNTSNLQHPRNSYPTTGDADYTVKLKITDISGCADSVTKVNYIKIRTPKAAFDIRDTVSICTPLRTRFTFKGSDYQSFYWDFGDGGTSTLQNPAYFYSNYGHYIPALYLQGPGGCMDSAKATVTLYDPVASTQINYGPVTTACNSLNVDFNLTVPQGFKFVFYFGDGTFDETGRTSFSHFYPRPSFNTPQLVIFDSITGCQVGIVGNPTINVLGAIPLFGKDKKEFCDNGTVTFTNFTVKNEPIISTTWDFGDGTTSNLDEPIHTFTQPGTYPVRLAITTQSNCTSFFTDTVYVYRTPIPSITGRDTICLNVPEPYSGFTLQPDTLTHWQWNFGNGQTPTVQNFSPVYTSTGNKTIQLTTTNKIGCGNTITKNIYVVPPPTAIPIQDPLTIISGASTPLPMNYTGNITSYNWVPAARVNCPTCPDPVATPQFTTTYTVRVTDIYGCRSSGDITVNVICNDKNFFVPNTFSPNGDGMNEVFYPRGTGLFSIKSLRVFNRWGQIVFEKMNLVPNDPSAGWDGKYKGQPAAPDVYVYMMEILCDNNAVIPVKGNVTLLR